MHPTTLLAFENELEKIAKSADHDFDKDLSFVERHPKKIIGGGLAALGAGAYLLSRGKKGRPPGGLHASSSPKPPAIPNKTPAAPHKPPARKMTHEEAKAAGYPGAGPKTQHNQSDEHTGRDYIQGVRDSAKMEGFSPEEYRSIDNMSGLQRLRKSRKKLP